MVTIDADDGVWYQEIELTDETGPIEDVDINGDTFMDCIVGIDLGVPIVINDGSGYLYIDRILPSSSTRLVATGDLNGDTFKDIVTCNSDDEARIWINDGYGDFTVTSQIIQCGEATAIVVEDRSSDTCLDVVFAYVDESEMVYLNDCSGQFTQQPTPTPTPEETATPTPTTP